LTSPFNIRKPASMKSVQEVSPEASLKPSENFKPEPLVGMTFNMPKSWHREFKKTALDEDINMHELLARCFTAYKKGRD
jgi:hypothetical protein